ncbi:MAG TPA: phosphoribosylformylglycinamidine synthase subunit PurL [Verrucomicrobiae bacterium]|nr:phosphoribosylformylglycinamidine synthase subunit PurL [Verrucomicrobiae bacterium]
MSAITPDVVAVHQITPSEYDKIISLLGREPTITELGIFSVMWSEHCSYKSSRLHLKKLPTRSKLVLQGPGENAGIIDIGDGYAIAFKIESHNHPSFIEPFQGAATGVGGILRDIFTMGARPIAVMDALRFGPLDVPRNRRILEGVVSGIAHYGNCFGVPTIGGECVFEACYNGNPLVNVFALGVFKHDEIFYGKATGIGNPVIYVGAKTGRDGVHGATMASAEFREESKQKRPNVQVGDPFMEKLLLEACLEAMKTGAIVGIQDMGAAGLTCSTCEMGSRANTGIDFDLERVPQRETGMTPYETMLSESQERMLLVAEKGREEEVFRVFRKWGLDAVTIGKVTADGMLRVRDHGEVVAEISNRALADEAPVYDRPHTKPYRLAPLEGPAIPERTPAELQSDLIALLSSGDICSKRWIWEQYDYSVRTNTLEGPGADVAVVRIKETGTSIAMALDGNARFCALDPREGTKLIVAECCRNLSVVGALPVAATNNLNFGNPERPEIMAQLVESIEGLAEACAFFETPITGGNVSLYNETLGEAIFPSPVIGIVGLMKTAKPTPIHFQNPDRAIVLLGGLGESDAQRFGGTEYAKVILNSFWGLPPKLDMDYEKRIHQAIREIVAQGLAESAHDLSDGGFAVALAECCFGPGEVGARVDLDEESNLAIALFHENPSRILISTADAQKIRQIAASHGVDATEIGVTMKEKLQINGHGVPLIDCEVRALRQPWQSSLEHLLRDSRVA